jgi:integrase
MAKDWPPPKDKWFPSFTAHRDGWVRSYKGRTRFIAGRNANRRQVEAAWDAKRQEIDAADKPDARPAAHGGLAYRDVLALFLADCLHRVETGKPRPMSRRTLHNYTVDLNAFGEFVGGGTPIGEIGPEQFTAFARKYGGWKASGFDSLVTRVGTLFRWAVEMEYIDRYRPGPAFQRPAKQDIRDQRISRQRGYAAEEIAKLYDVAGNTLRCWIGLGICAAFNNSDIANLTRTAVDFEAGLIDFRRRKTGKLRRVCPLPPAVVADLKAYRRPEPVQAAEADLFFLTINGVPYARTGAADYRPSDSISRLFSRLIKQAGVKQIEGRNFAGLRTSFPNLAPPGYRDEVEMIMGHAHGTMLTDHYLEEIGLERVRHVVTTVWDKVWSEVLKLRASSASQIRHSGEAQPRHKRGPHPLPTDENRGNESAPQS